MKLAIVVIIFSYILDLIVGDPSWFYHPVIIIGKLISFVEKKVRIHFNSKKGGAIIVFSTIFVVSLVMMILGYVFFKVYILGYLLSWIAICTTLSTKCLACEAKKISNKLKHDTIENARVSLSYIVGRETSSLDEEEIIRATVETVAENTVDGTISPMFYAFIGALIGMVLFKYIDIDVYSNIDFSVHFLGKWFDLSAVDLVESKFCLIGAITLSMVYKAINTMDSMIGYKNEKYINIGMVAAKLDDFANFIPARLSLIMFTISSFLLRYDYKSCVRIGFRDRKNHKSPNCAYSEGAVAGALGVRLGGNNVYFGEVVEKPTIGDKKRSLNISDIDSTIKLLYMSSFVSILVFSIVFSIVFSMIC